VDGDAPMAAVVAPPSAAGPAGRLADLQQRKRDIEDSLVTLEQLQEAEQAAATAKMNAATNSTKLKQANAQDRSMSKRGEEGVAQEQAQNAHKLAKSTLAAARKRQTTDKASVQNQGIADLEAAAAAAKAKQEIADLERAEQDAQEARTLAEKKFQAAKAAVLQRVNELVEKASGLARTAQKTAEALAQLKRKKAEDEKALRELNSAIKSASLEEKKEGAAAQKEAKAAEKEAEKEARAAAKQAQKEAKERAEKCEELACEIHRFRDKIANDLRKEADDIMGDLVKNKWCEGPDGEDQLTIPKADADWFKALVRFVQKTEDRLTKLIERGKNVGGEPLDWRSARHEYMLNDVCDEVGGGDESNGMGKLVGSSSEEEEGGPDEDIVVGDIGEADSDFTDEDAAGEWDRKRRMAAVEHIRSGEHKKEMYKKFPAQAAAGDDPEALEEAAREAEEGKTPIQRALEEAERKKKLELMEPAEAMEPRKPAPIDILSRDEPAAPSAASKPEKKTKKRITPQRTDEDPPEGGD